MSNSRNTKYCSVEACPSKSTDGAKLHYFPRDDAQREAWTEFVRGSGLNSWVPKKASRLCSLHFADDCYRLSPKLMSEFARQHTGLRLHTNLLLVPGAVPTIYVPTADDPAHGGATEPKRRKSEVSTRIMMCLWPFVCSHRVMMFGVSTAHAGVQRRSCWLRWWQPELGWQLVRRR